MARATGVGVVVLVVSCTIGAPGTFTLSNASADSGYSCPRGSHNASYDIHASVDSHNGTSRSVAIKSVTAVMTLTAAHGDWLQQVGSKYNAGQVSFGPLNVGAGTDTKLTLIIPSACTNGLSVSTTASYADYSIAFTVTTSVGTSKLDAKNRHRITAA
ncbi:MAG TPA: hypothetical protein VGU71_15420 [Candidatus Dormibacteraeota bacterium]|nr:hypothetical protein [Candidatus Dormibacteraeota bacterium]